MSSIFLRLRAQRLSRKGTTGASKAFWEKKAAILYAEADYQDKLDAAKRSKDYLNPIKESESGSYSDGERLP